MSYPPHCVLNTISLFFSSFFYIFFTDIIHIEPVHDLHLQFFESIIHYICIFMNIGQNFTIEFFIAYHLKGDFHIYTSESERVHPPPIYPLGPHKNEFLRTIGIKKKVTKDY